MTLSTDLTTVEAAAKAAFDGLVTDIESAVSAIASDLSTVFSTLLANVDPILMAAASAGVTAALSTTTGGLGAILSAAEGAAKTVLVTQGTAVTEQAAVQLTTLVAANVLKTTANPSVVAPAVPATGASNA